MNNINEEKLIYILVNNELSPFFDEIFNKFVSGKFDKTFWINLISFLDNQKYHEFLIITFLILDSINSKKIKEYIKACFNISLSNENINTIEKSVYLINEIFPEKKFIDDIYKIVKEINITSMITYKYISNYLKYYHVYYTSSLNHQFEFLIVKILFYGNNLKNIVYSLDLIEFIVDHVFMKLINRKDKNEYKYFFELFNKKFIENLLNDNDNNYNVPILDKTKNKDIKFYRDLVCIYLIFQYRLYFTKFKEKYMNSMNTEDSFYENSFKMLTIYQV